jgi:hypothetical protein
MKNKYAKDVGVILGNIEEECCKPLKIGLVKTAIYKDRKMAPEVHHDV